MISRALLKTADVLVHASLWEGMPNVVLEAMAAGLPVIGTAVEGTEDLVVPGQTGWLVPPREPQILSRVLIEAVDSPKLASNTVKQGDYALNENSHLKKQWRPTNAFGPEFWGFAYLQANRRTSWPEPRVAHQG